MSLVIDMDSIPIAVQQDLSNKLESKLESLGIQMEARFDQVAQELSFMKERFFPPIPTPSVHTPRSITPRSNIQAHDVGWNAMMEAVKESVLIQRATQQMLKEVDLNMLTQLARTLQSLEQMKATMPSFKSPERHQVAYVPLPPDDVVSIAGTRSTMSTVHDDPGYQLTQKTRDFGGGALSHEPTWGSLPPTPSEIGLIATETGLLRTQAGGATTTKELQQIAGDSCPPPVENETMSEESESRAWYVGNWVDKTGNFFHGSVITIKEDSWIPRVKELDTSGLEAGTNFSVETQPDNGGVFLIEQRPDGEVRTFKAHLGIGMSSMIVSLSLDSGRELTWTLKSEQLDRKPTENLTITNYTDKLKQEKEAQQHKYHLFETDLDLSEGSGWPAAAFRRKLRTGWEIGVVALLACSLVCHGMSVEFMYRGRTPAHWSDGWEVFENFCIVILIIDVAFRTYKRRQHGVCCGFWLIFDSFIVVVSATYQWLIQHVVSERHELAVWFRCLKLLRVTRILRNMIAFSSESKNSMAELLRHSTKVLAVIGGVLLVTYAFACLGVEFIACSDLLREEFDQMNRFDGIYPTMITLFTEFVTPLDQGLFGPMITLNPWLIFYFVLLFLVVPLSLMTVALAMVGESTMKAVEKARNDYQEHLNIVRNDLLKEVPVYQDFFNQIEKKDDKVLHRAEFSSLGLIHLPEEMQSCQEKFNFHSMGEFFDILDHSAAGTLTQRQFVKGMLNLRIAEMSSVPPETLLILMHVRVSDRRRVDMMRNIEVIHSQVAQLFLKICKGVSLSPDYLTNDPGLTATRSDI